MKRILCSLLSILFVVGIFFSVPMTASALDKDFEYLGTYEIEEQINPLYKGLVDESDVITKKPDVYYSDDLSDFNESLYSSDKEVSATAMREGMEDRLATVTIYYKADKELSDSEYDSLFNELQKLALKETDVATQGDSLRYGYKSVAANITGVSDGINYYYKYIISYEYYTTAEQEEELTQKVEEVIEAFAFTDETTEKAKSDVIYDYITDNVTYDHDNLNDSTYYLKFTPYAALVNKTAVCQGYAMLYYRFAEETGLDCRVVSGKSQNQNHAWNIVKLGSYYYYLDSTWDAGEEDYSYYLKGSAEFPDHTNEERFETTEFKTQYPIPEYYGSSGVASDFSYSITEEGAVITAYNGTATVLTTPAVLGGETVVGIGPGVFSREANSTVESLTISEGVIWLSEQAFDYSETLKELHLPSTLTIQTDDYAAYAAGNGVMGVGINTAPFSCDNLETITVADGNTNIKVVDGVLYSYDGKKIILYPAGKKDITTFTVPATVEEIVPDAFGECCLTEIVFPENSALKCLHYWSIICARNLEKINLGDTNCEFIGQFALTHTSLKQLSIPATTTFIGVDAFSSECNLSKITVAEGNTEYVVEENGLYEIDTNTLLRYACDETVKIATVKDGTERIAYGAFEQKEFLERILLPDSLVEINNSAFSGCKKLTSITIPQNVTTLGHTYSEGISAVFLNCEKLASVTILNDNCNIADDIFHSQYKFATIYGNKGSKAEEYANTNEITFKELTDDFVCDTDGCKLEFAVIEGENEFLETYQCTVCGSHGFAEIDTNWRLDHAIYELDFTEKTYTGNPIEPQIKSIIYKKYKSETEYETFTLVEGVDYTKEYVNNVNVSVDGGSYIKLTGKGKFNNTTLEIPFTITPVELSEPQNVKVIYADTNTFIISWDEIEGADGYHIYENDNDGRGWYKIYTGTETSYNTWDLNADTEARYKIVGYHHFETCDRDSINFVEKTIKTFKRLECTGDFTLTNVDFGEVKLEWDSVDGADVYKIYLYENNQYIELGTTEECEYEIGGLSEGTVYSCKVVPCVYYSEGNQYVYDGPCFYSDAITTWRNLPKPTDLNAFLLTPDTIRLSWNISDEASGSRIYYKKASDAEFTEYIDLGRTTSEDFTDLEPGMEYDFRIYEIWKNSGIEAAIEGTEYASVTCRVPQKLVAPVGLTAEQISDIAVRLRWGLVEDATGYHVYYKLSTDSEYTYLYYTEDPMYDVNNLKSGNTYDFKVLPYLTLSSGEVLSEKFATVSFKLGCIHSDTVTIKGTPATCTDTGLTDGKKCSVCGTTTVAQQTIAKKAHTEVTITGKAATCTATGLTDGKKCSVCGTTTVAQQTIAKKAHTEVNITGKAATCTATGLTDGKKCSVCGTTTVAQQTIAKKAHTEVTVTGKAATCTATGLTDGKKCSVCGTVTKAQETIKATGHKEVVIPAVAPTYGAVGKTEGKKCSVCGTITVAQKDVAKLTLATPVVTVKNSATGVKVTWGAIDGAESYKVYRKTYSTKTKKYGSWKTCGTVTTTSYVDTKAKSGTKYVYTVKALNNDTNSDIKNSSSILFLSQPTVKIANNASGVKVTWNKITGATGYKVYRAEYVNGKWSGWKSVKTIDKGSTVSWTDKSVKSGVKYKYTVKAVNGKTGSTYKSSSSLLYLAQPKVAVKALSNGIKVAWVQSTGATSYKIYRSEYNAKTKKWSSWKGIKTAKSTSKSYTDKSAKKGVKYRYTVKAVNGKTASSYKSSSSVKR